MKKNLLKSGRLILLIATVLSHSASVHAQVYNKGNLYLSSGSSVSFWGNFANAPTGIVDNHAPVLYVNGDVADSGSIAVASGSVVSFLGTNWANTGTATFSGTGNISFDGSSSQNIDGGYTSGAQPSFPGLTINNAGNVNLINTATSVSNSLAFTSGSVLLGNNNLRLDATANISGAGAGKFAVTNGAGYLVKNGVANSGSFSFPVGQALNDYTPASISNTSGAARNYTVNVGNYSTSAATEGNATKGIDRTWQIFADASGSANITLSHNAATNTNGPGTNGASFNNSAAYVSQQVTSGDWSTSSTTSNGGSPVNILNSSSAVTLPALATAATGYFTKTSDQINSVSTTLEVSPVAFLQGPYNVGTGLMTTTLNSSNLLPLTQPYSAAPFNYSGTESVTAIPNANVTDWVLVQLLDPVTPTTVISTRAAFLLNNGNIVDLDGSTPVRFNKTIPAGNYHVSVVHRNHLAMRTASVRALAKEINSPYNFSTASTQAFNTNAMVNVGGGVWAMWAGDANSDGSVYNSASPSDKSLIVNGVANHPGNILHSAAFTGYSNVYNQLDINLDGKVYSSSSPSDATIIINNVANYPANILHSTSFIGVIKKI